MGYLETTLKSRARILVLSLLAAVCFIAADIIYYVETRNVPFFGMAAALVWVVNTISNLRMVIQTRRELKALKK